MLLEANNPIYIPKLFIIHYTHYLTTKIGYK